MARLDHDRCCDEVVAQTTLLRDALSGADLSLVVPTTPDWTLGDLARHVGGNLLAGEQAVRTGTAVTEPERQVPGHGGPAGDDPAALDAWLAEAADRFAETLRKAGPATEAQIWVVRWPTAAWARRAAHDVVVHRADAAGAVGAAYLVDPEVAADAVDEFLDLLSNPQVAGSRRGRQPPRDRAPARHRHPSRAGVRVAGRAGAPTFSWRHAHEKATVAVRAPVADVLRVVTRRLPPGGDTVEVLGDRALLDAWLERLVLR